MSRPEPRPALQRSEDGSVHPAAPRVVPEQHLHPVPHAPAAASKSMSAVVTASDRQAPAQAGEFTGRPAKLNVEIPKDLRKETRKLAERSGQSLDAVVVEALARHIASETHP